MHLLLLAASLIAGTGGGVVISGDPAQGGFALRRLAREADSMALYFVVKSDRTSLISKSSDRRDLQAFFRSIGTLESSACICMSSWEVEFLRGGKPIGSMWVQPGLHLHIAGVPGALHPINPEALANWFVSQGELFPRKLLDQMNEDAAAEVRAKKAVPEAMRGVWPGYGDSALQKFRQRLLEWRPNVRDRILALLAWYGQAGGSSWVNFQSEDLLEGALLKENANDFVAVLRGPSPLTTEQLDGAARLVSLRVPWKIRKPPSPPPFRWTLWDSITAELQSHIPGRKAPVLEMPKPTQELEPAFEPQVNRAWLRMVPPELRVPHAPEHPIVDLVVTLPREVRTELLVHIARSGRRYNLEQARLNLE